MKGVILAGGYGTRLLPMTRVTNKHLLPVYDRPMVFFPLETLRDAGITEVMLVTGGNQAGDFVELLGSGKQFGLTELAYAYQEGAGGIADALRLAEDFTDGEPMVVVLGDNIIEGSIAEVVSEYREQLDREGSGARIILKEVDDPQRFGVAEFDAQGRLTGIIEKPADPPSRQAVIGIYLYDNQVFDIIHTLKPSARGELEITDVNNRYLSRGQLEYSVLEGWWSDAGTIESLYRSTQLVAEKCRQDRATQTAGGLGAHRGRRA